MKINRYQQLTVLFVLLFNLSSYAQYTWTQKAAFAGTSRYAACSFAIGGKGYLGTGFDGSIRKDFWEYDPATDIWTQKADYGGPACYAASSFVSATKGYIGLGRTSFPSAGYSNDLWEYDPVMNSWSQKSSFPGNTRYTAVSFSCGSKGYAGTGYNGALLGDFWEYDMNNDNWNQKTDLAGTSRQSGAGFSIGGIGYLGTGYDGSNRKDFWEYTPSMDAWTQKADFSGLGRYGAVAFEMMGKGYLGLGRDGSNLLSDIYSYDPLLNNWSLVGNYPGTNHSAHVAAFSIWNKAYIGTGSDLNTTGGSFTDSIWELSVAVTSLQAVNSNANSTCQVFPSVFSGSSRLIFLSNVEKITLNVYDMAGRKIESLQTDKNLTFGNNWHYGIYNLEILTENKREIIRVVKTP
jgi:N-acetylneuraminic acid mutarotase